MAHVIATINLKGGVGKTTTTVALAEFLSAEFGKRVLVIDLDPQTNATVVLIGEDRWQALNYAHRTLAALFEDALRPEHERARFELNAAVQRQVSRVTEVKTVDLLPSSIDLIYVQDRLASMSPGRFHARSPVDVLGRAVRPVLDDYDYVLVDCPPNLGIVTLNGLRIADGYIVPTIPDHLSIYGIHQIPERVRAFADDVGTTIRELGVVVTKYREDSRVHKTVVDQLERAGRPVVFRQWIHEANAIAATADSSSYWETLKQKYNYQRAYQEFRALTEEFISAVEDAL